MNILKGGTKIGVSVGYNRYVPFPFLDENGSSNSSSVGHVVGPFLRPFLQFSFDTDQQLPPKSDHRHHLSLPSPPALPTTVRSTITVSNSVPVLHFSSPSSRGPLSVQFPKPSSRLHPRTVRRCPGRMPLGFPPCPAPDFRAEPQIRSVGATRRCPPVVSSSADWFVG